MAHHPSQSPAIQAALLGFVDVRRTANWQGWRELARDAPPFLAPEFFVLAAPLADGTPVVALASEAGRLVGALPLQLTGRTLRTLACLHTPGFDYVGSPEGLDAAWAALRRDRRWSELLLENIPAGSLLARRLPALAKADRYRPTILPGPVQRVLPLPGFEATLDQRFRMGLRRCERKAGSLELERVARPTRADFRDAFAIEAMAWKGAAGTSIEADPKAGHLYQALGRLFGAHGRAHLYFLRVRDRRIAVAVTVEGGGAIYALKVGYDPQESALGPGHLLVWKLAADAERRGLERLEFLGRDSEWKRKWTDQASELVSVRMYQRSARGMLLHGLREVVKPRLPERMRDLRTPLRGGCQRGDVIGSHTLVERIRGRLDAGLGIKWRLQRALSPSGPPRATLGEPSAFQPGDWVRVLDAEHVRATLGADSSLRGLKFIPQQWVTCGRTYRVQKQVRRMRSDAGRYIPISRTVLLEGVTCAGEGPGPMGCGRHCPTMFRDDWLEPAPRPRIEPNGPSKGRHARVRELEEIIGGLDLTGRRDGLQFMPEMAQYAGRRFSVVEGIPKVFEHDRWIDPRRPVFVLEGLHCGGSVPGEPGPCDRACALLWHEDWLLLEPGPRADG